MKKIRLLAIIFSGLVSLFLFAYLPSNKAFAIDGYATPNYRDENTEMVTVTFTGINQPSVYFCLKKDGKCPADGVQLIKKDVVAGKASIDTCAANDTNLKEGACGPSDYFWAKNYDVWIYPNTDKNDTCSGEPCMNPDDSLKNVQFDVNHYYPIPSFNPSNITPGTEFIFKLEGLRRPNNEQRNDYNFEMKDNSGNKISSCSEKNWATVPNGYFTKPCTLVEGKYFLHIYDAVGSGSDNGFEYYIIQIDVKQTGSSIIVTVDPGSKDKGEIVDIPGLKVQNGLGSNPCGSTCDTAIGPIPIGFRALSQKLLDIAIGVAGGIALILMVIGSIRVLMSSGDPQKLGGGRDMIVAAVAGLLFLLFAVLILRFIGITVLKGVPGIP